MGTDIHLFVEYDVGHGPGSWKKGLPDKVVPPAFTVEDNVKSFTEGAVLIPRDYNLFDALTGVRQSPDNPPPAFAPRGFPSIASLDVLRAYFRCVREGGEELWDPHQEITRSDAEKWVADGRSTYRNIPKKPNGWVSDPDYHTASWLTYDELLIALHHHNLELSLRPIEFQALLSLVAALELSCPNGTRVIFWFDN